MRFESDVISDGTQTCIRQLLAVPLFESDVISDGTQTRSRRLINHNLFESDVISDGTQTHLSTCGYRHGLRVM